MASDFFSYTNYTIIYDEESLEEKTQKNLVLFLCFCLVVCDTYTSMFRFVVALLRCKDELYFSITQEKNKFILLKTSTLTCF